MNGKPALETTRLGTIGAIEGSKRLGGEYTIKWSKEESQGSESDIFTY